MNWITVVAKLANFAYSGLKVYDLLNKTGVIKRVLGWLRRK